VTKPTEDSGELLTAVEVSNSCAEEDVFWQLPLAPRSCTADILKQ
jgi:hypothetical protein